MEGLDSGNLGLNGVAGNGALEVWKTTVDVQKHFNELELKIRNFAITVVGAFLAAFAITTTSLSKEKA